MKNYKKCCSFTTWCMYKFLVMFRIFWTVLVTVVLSCNVVTANNVRIKGEVKIQALNDSTALLTFPLSWEHSWREGENWDAVWIFAKYKRKGVNEPWHHVYLKEKGHKAVGGEGLPPMEFIPQYTTEYWPLRYDTLFLGRRYTHPTTGVDKKVVPGLFICRKKPGTGDINIPRVSLEWNFKEGDLNLDYEVTLDDIRKGRIEVSAQAIEMVYVPVGPFYLGDRTSAYSFVSDAMDQAYYVATDDEQTVYSMGAIASGTDWEKSWTVPATYPMGYTGFYMMKYEVSQEQYVNFLNRLTLRDQKIRIGDDWDHLKPGDYVFGQKKAEPYYRNGIILVEKYTALDTPAVFGYNLNGLNPRNYPDDGKSIPCNYLTPEDMIAYLDWAGLRPHSEAEYEKGCRQRNPGKFYADRSYAWGTPEIAPLNWDLDVVNQNREDEQVANGKNSNGASSGVKYPAPVRCGAFATGTPDQFMSGASKWGLMEMTGNVAEIYYNADEGKDFREDVFGDGNIWSSVSTWNEDSLLTLTTFISYTWNAPDTNYVNFDQVIAYPTMSKRGRMMYAIIKHKEQYRYCVKGPNLYDQEGRYIGYNVTTTLKVPFPTFSWPDTSRMFALKGGSFADNDPDLLAVSCRKQNQFFRDYTESPRLKHIGFRGGRSVPVRTITSGEIICGNMQKKDTAFICDTHPYTISEYLQGEDDAASSIYSWEIDDGSGWKEIKGSNVKDLVLDRVINDSLPWKEYTFRRHSIATHAEAYSNEVVLCIPGYTVSGEGGMEIGGFDTFVNLMVNLGTQGTVFVKWLDKSTDPTGVWQALGTPVAGTGVLPPIEIRRDYFNSYIANGKNGTVELLVQIVLENGCTIEIERKVIMDTYNTPGAADPILDIRDNKTYRTAILADGRIWMIEDLQYDFSAGTGYPAATHGNYTVDHIYADLQGTKKLCPDGYELPESADWLTLLQWYCKDGDVIDGTTFPCFDGTNLFDPGLSNFINGFFGVTTGSAGYNENSGYWWDKDGNLFGFQADPFWGKLIFGPESVDPGSQKNEVYKVRCVKTKKLN